MSVKIFFFCILFAQTSASFFDEFRGAMSSVENSFGKLLSDVVTDVRDTIGCTILAVKQVLALGGIFHESSEYDARCRGISDTPSYIIQERNNNYAPTPPFIFTTPIVYTTQTAVTEKSRTEKVSEELDESIKKVNNTMFQIISDSDTRTRGKMENVTNSLLNESDRLNKISSLLHRELNNISEDIKAELSQLEPDINNPTAHDIWSNIKALHEIEINHSNTPEAIEIHHILDEVLSVLRGYDYQSGVSIEFVDKRDSNNTFTEIKNQFLKMKLEESQDLNTVEDIVEIDLNDAANENKLEVNEFPVTFKGIAKKIMDDTTRTLRLDEDSQKYEELTTTSTEGTMTTVETYEEDTEDPMESPEYTALFQLPKDSKSRKEAAEAAQKLIEKSKENDAVLNSYFEKSSDIGTSVFDDPDLFNFGK